jgi:serine/threonine protein kinase
MAYGGAALGRVNGFVLQKLLGKGSFGTVYQAIRETDGKTYAIKKVDTRKMGAKDRAEAVNEIRVLASVAGAHIISFFEAFVEQDMLYIVTEFAGHGDLFGWLKEARKRGPLKEATIWSLFIQMSLGLKSLHDRNILHRDLKGANIFMCSPTYIKLGELIPSSRSLLSRLSVSSGLGCSPPSPLSLRPSHSTACHFISTAPACRPLRHQPLPPNSRPHAQPQPHARPPTTHTTRDYIRLTTPRPSFDLNTAPQPHAGDFGVSKVLKSDQALARTQVGTPYYVAPEVWRNRPYNASCDIWSLGCLLYELCTFRPPFEADSMEGLARKIMQGKYSPIPAGYSRELHSLVARLLVVDPARRATVDDILAHKGVQERMASIPSADSLTAAMGDAPVDLVGTIIVPQRFNDLHKNLPPSRYEAQQVPAPAPAAPPAAPPPAAPPAAPAPAGPYPGQTPGQTKPLLAPVMDAQGRVPIAPRGQPNPYNPAPQGGNIVPRGQPNPYAPAPQGGNGYYPAPPRASPLPYQPAAVPQSRYPDSAVPSLPPVPGAARKPPVSASAAAARQMAQPNYRPLQPAVPGRPISRPGSGAARPGSGAGARPGSANIRVVYHNPLSYQQQQGSNHSIFRGNSNANSQYNPITHQASYLARQPPPQAYPYQSRLAKIHNPSQQHLHAQAMYAAQQGRVPIRGRA